MPAWAVIPVLVVAGFVPGWLVVRQFGRGRLSLPQAFAALVLGLAALGWAALVLAELGVYSLGRLGLVWVVLVGGLLILDRGRDALSDAPPNPLPRGEGAARLPAWAEPVFLAAWAVAAGWLFFRPHEYVLGAADAGVYVSIGASIAREGGIVIQDETLAGLDEALYPWLLRPQPDNPVAPAPRPAPAPSATKPAPVAQMAEAPATAPSAHPGEVDIHALWPGLLDAIGRVSPFARSYFIEAHPVSFAKNVFTIGFDPEFADHIGMVDNAKNHAMIATKLSEMGVRGAQVKIVKSERPGGFTAPAPAEAAPAPAPVATTPQARATPAPAKAAAAPAAKPVQLDPAEFKNDPLIKKALEVFKGTIVEVRA